MTRHDYRFDPVVCPHCGHRSVDTPGIVRAHLSWSVAPVVAAGPFGVVVNAGAFRHEDVRADEPVLAVTNTPVRSPCAVHFRCGACAWKWPVPRFPPG